MNDEPEFDLIIDTYGELGNADEERVFKNEESHFLTLLGKNIKKLLPEGRLFVSFMGYHPEGYLTAKQEKLEEKYAIQIELKTRPISVVITKNKGNEK